MKYHNMHKARYYVFSHVYRVMYQCRKGLFQHISYPYVYSSFLTRWQLACNEKKCAIGLDQLLRKCSKVLKRDDLNIGLY